MSQSQAIVAPRSSRTFRQALGKVLRKPQFWFAALGIIPTLIWYTIFGFAPIVRAFPMAIQSYDILNPAASKLVGFDNWRRISELPLFWLSIRNTLYWALLSFVESLPIAMIVSLSLANVARGRNFYQGLIFLPVVVSLVAIVLLFKMLLDPEIGQINQVLRLVGLKGVRWLSDRRWGLPSSVAIGVWKGLGFQVVLITAGLMAVPEEIYDAARVDGVNEWQRLWRITMPLLANTILLVTVLMAIGSLQVWTLPFLLGGQTQTTYVYNQLIFTEAFDNLRFGSAAAASLLQFAFILIVTLFQIKLIRPAWSY